MQERINRIRAILGINDLFQVRHGRLQGNTKLATIRGKNYTVSQLLKSITFLLKFIKNNFNENEHKYSVTIIFLKSLQLVLNNVNADKPNKEDLHNIIDVFHEISDMLSKNDREKELNEEIAAALDYLVDISKSY